MSVLTGKQAKALKALLQDQNLGANEKLNKLREMYVKAAAELNKVDSAKRALETKLADMDKQLVLSNKQKDKVETLCRELHRSNKKVIEDNHKRLQEENAKRMEQQEKFSGSIQNISKQLEEYEADRISKAEENQKLQETLNDYIQKYDQFKDLITKQSEVKTKETELQQAQAKIAIESMQQELQKITINEQDVTKVKQENLELRKRIKLNEAQLVEYQKTSTQTSELVASVKDEIKRMNKRSKAVESQNEKVAAELKRSREKFEQQLTEQTTLVRKQRGQLENLKILCRSLQAVKSEQEKTIEALTKQLAEKEEKEELAKGERGEH